MPLFFSTLRVAHRGVIGCLVGVLLASCAVSQQQEVELGANTAAQVSARSLEKIFCERYGLPPVRYLKLRRLHATRRALLRSGPADTTVTQIAIAHGFAHLGRFSADYAALFGEPPSETLGRA